MEENKKEKIELTNEQKLIMGIAFDDENAERELIKPLEFGDENGPRELVMGLDFSDDDKDPEKFEFCIMFKYADDNDNEIKDWEIIIGRKNMYEFIMDNIESMDIDESYIINQNITFKDKLTVYEFVKYIIEEGGHYQSDSNTFRIDDYK